MMPLPHTHIQKLPFCSVHPLPELHNDYVHNSHEEALLCLRFLCLLHQLHAKQERNSPQRVKAILKLRFRMFLLQQPVISLL